MVEEIEAKVVEEKKEETVPKSDYDKLNTEFEQLKNDFQQLGRSYFAYQQLATDIFKMAKDVGHNLVQMGSALQEHQQKNEQIYAVAISEVYTRNEMAKRKTQEDRTKAEVVKGGILEKEGKK